MSDWQVGDLAVCVDRGMIRCVAHGVRVEHSGGVLPQKASIVRAIGPSVNKGGVPMSCGCVRLSFDNGSFGISRRFRKIRPDEHEACEAEFVTLLKRSKVPALLEDEGSCQEVTKQIREWREEDRRAGILWADNRQSERDGA